ncbi:ATP-binding protein [Actinoplanes sp. NPDC051346]|uniref:ATP-binding protein n=1 Tax=Actinoplanes sp. NPDC051346 TaxID=3155048 RepID=UPI0034368DD9
MSGPLEGLPVSRVLELPRRPPSTREGPGTDVGRRQRLAAIVSAYHAGTTLLLGWHRRAAAGPVEVFAAGGISGEPDLRGLTPLSLPPGGLGRPYPGPDLLGTLRAVPCWTRVAGLTDGLLVDDSAPADEDVRPTLDECLLHVWHAGFAWFVLAEPVPADEIVTIARQVALEERQAQSKSQSPEQAVAAARLQRRHRELQQGRSTGMWRVHLLVGGDSPAGAAAVAGLLCASADLDRQPYALAPTGLTGDLDKILHQEVPDSPVLAGSPLLASLAVTPVEEVPGLRFAMRSEFDVTPETAGRDPGALSVGTVLDRTETPVGPLEIPRASLNRHTFVCGATGAGKSQTVRHLLEGATAERLPWLVVEPAKAEYRQMADRIGAQRVITVRPGDTRAAPAGFNPLRPADGFPLQTHLDLTRSLFLAAFEADEPFPQVLSAALTRCYEELGWDLALSEARVPGHHPRYPTLGDLQRTAELVVDQIGYGKEITDNVRGFIRVRLSSLRLGTTGRFFEGGHPLDLTELTRHNVVFEIEDVGDDSDKAFLMGGLLIQLTEHLRVRTRRDPVAALGLRHLSVFEEAHRLLRRTEKAGPASHAVELFAALLAEIRAYGEGLIIAEQIPSKLVPDVIKNTAIKIMHRLPAADDREAVGATVNLTDRQSQFLVTLPPGVAAVFADGMDQPVLVRMPDGTPRERGGHTPTAPADAIIGRRSRTCGASCLASACTLRDMRTAQRYLQDEPWLAVWAELAVLGHLTGWPTPALRAHRIRQLLDLPPRSRECAMSHAVDEAVAARSSVLSTHSDPASVAEHVLAAMTGYLDGVFDCADEELAFLARPYRWARLADILDAAAKVDDAGPRHPRSAAWASAYGREIPGETVGMQAAAVRRWLESDTSDATVRRNVALGVRTPGALERAVGSTFEARDWTERVETVLSEEFVNCHWPTRFLVPVEATDGSAVR